MTVDGHLALEQGEQGHFDHVQQLRLGCTRIVFPIEIVEENCDEGEKNRSSYLEPKSCQATLIVHKHFGIVGVTTRLEGRTATGVFPRLLQVDQCFHIVLLENVYQVQIGDHLGVWPGHGQNVVRYPEVEGNQ